MMKELEQYIRMLIENETNATKDMPYGNHLFGLDRGLGEWDTDEERKFAVTLFKYISNNSSNQKLSKYLYQALALMKDGKYEDMLKPLPGMVYRGMNISEDYSKKMFNVGYDEIFNSGVYQVEMDGVSYSPIANDVVGSWSYGKKTAEDFASDGTYRRDIGKSNRIAAVFSKKLPTSDGIFIMNSKELEKIGNKWSRGEREVLSVGEIKNCKLNLYVGT